MNHYVYVVECSDDRDSLYVGYTTDVERRLAEHNAGEGAKYTRGRTPVTLRYVEYRSSRGDALSREHELKQLRRADKRRLLPESSDCVRISLGDDENA